MTPKITRVAASVAATALALLLTSCASEAPNGAAGPESTSAAIAPAEGAPSNAADVVFASDMIPHHQQAVELSGLVAGRSTNPAVAKLAAEISAAQGPEIEIMKVWLVQWDPNAGMGDPGHDDRQDGAQMAGMVDDASMAKLRSLSGAPFDHLWLTSMIGHHEGAIEMANAEIANGLNVDAKRLAGQIVTGQQAEVVQMKTMIGG